MISTSTLSLNLRSKFTNVCGKDESSSRSMRGYLFHYGCGYLRPFMIRWYKHSPFLLTPSPQPTSVLNTSLNIEKHNIQRNNFSRSAQGIMNLGESDYAGVHRVARD